MNKPLDSETKNREALGIYLYFLFLWRLRLDGERSNGGERMFMGLRMENLETSRPWAGGDGSCFACWSRSISLPC